MSLADVFKELNLENTLFTDFLDSIAMHHYIAKTVVMNLFFFPQLHQKR